MVKPIANSYSSEAVVRYAFRELQEQDQERLDALEELIEKSIVEKDGLDRILQLCTDACVAFRELGDRWKEAHMLCTMATVCMERGQVEQAEHHARSAVRLANGLGERTSRSEALSILATVFLMQPDKSEKAVMLLQQEQAACIDERDELGEAMCLLSLANIYMELGRPKLVISAAEDARKIFKASKDPMGEVTALQILADVHARGMRYSEVLSAVEKAIPIAESLKDTVTISSLLVSAAQATLGLIETGSQNPKSPEFASIAESAEKYAKRAVMLARDEKRSDLMISALCTLCQAQYLSGQKQAARQAAVSAGSLSRRVGDRLGEGTASLLLGHAYVALGKMESAKEAASKGLYVFEELHDLIGQDLAKATIDAISNPVSALAAAGTVRVVRRKKTNVNASALKDKVRSVVSEIVGMDNLVDDTPLMQAGLTSQSAVLLRNALSKEIPSQSSLPFTLMFDYPSIADLSQFFVGSAGDEEEEVEEWIEVADGMPQALASVATGPKPEDVRKQVRSVVAEIVGMDDLVDDTPLMQAGLTSQSAVLLRNALSKEMPGASLPFTMMFDYPSVSALTDFFVARAVPEAPDISEIAAASQGEAVRVPRLDGDKTRHQVRKIVTDIVGMDDFDDEAALMAHGVTSTTAVLIRDELSKQFPGPNMPHTLIFDFPSVMDLTEFVLERSSR